jgi:photosystem II stability/assembly factor-like uncharacterized protein
MAQPQFLMQEVASIAIDTRQDRVRLLIGTSSPHWGPTVMWSDDLGATWQETEHGAIQFPADTGAALERVWQLQPDSAERAGIVWAGCEPTSLWRSDDGGANFALVRGLWDHPHRTEWHPGFGGAAVHTVVSDPKSSRVLAAMSTGGVYISEDGADTWHPSNRGISVKFAPDPYPEYGQCVHKVAAGGGQAERLFAQNHHGVYRSDDAGASWSSIADGLPSDFGFPVLAHPREAETAWVIPMTADEMRVPPEGRLRVHRTRDGGASWTELGEGLPDSAWAVVLRDAACVDDSDPTGVYLGTRDGCVYASADEGDHFTQVAAHLPDVLCVRAAQIG